MAGIGAARDHGSVQATARRAVSVVVVALVAAGVAGCSIGDVRRDPGTTQPPPPPPPPAAPSDEPVPVVPYDVRRVRVPVPADYAQRQVEFTDAGHGYALFTSCRPAPTSAGTPPPCLAILLSTADGGRTWQRLNHPHPVAENHQLYAQGVRLVLLAEPYGWYASTDRGGSFTHLPPTDGVPAVYRALFGRFQVCCEGDGPDRVVEWVGDRPRPVPAQPELPAIQSVAYADGRVFAAGLRDGRPYTAVSVDQGRTWRRPVVVPAADGLISVLTIKVNSDDAWLVGYADDRTSFPWLWWYTGGDWHRVDAPDHPPRVFSVVAIGDGLLAMSGPDGGGLVGPGRYEAVGWPVDADLRLLEDGSLLAVRDGGARSIIWLAPGYGDDRRWIKLALDVE